MSLWEHSFFVFDKVHGDVSHFPKEAYIRHESLKTNYLNSLERDIIEFSALSIKRGRRAILRHIHIYTATLFLYIYIHSIGVQDV